MKITSLRKAFLAVALVAGTAALVSPVLAQTPPGPPICGSVAGLMRMDIYADGFGAKGDNIVSAPGVGPLTANPSDTSNNGFRQICARFGLGNAGDAAATSTLIQFNAQTGQTFTFTCNQSIAPTWLVGQAALVRPSGTGSAVGPPIAGSIPGVECARPYTSYGEGAGATGDNMYPVPLTITSNSPAALCTQLNLPAGSSIIQFVADLGNINTHSCGAAATFSLKLGGGVLIRPTGAAGAAVATGTPTIY